MYFTLCQIASWPTVPKTWNRILVPEKANLHVPPIFLRRWSDMHRAIVRIYCSSSGDASKLHETIFVHTDLIA